MHIAVTGASGFIGGWIARLLEENGHEVFSFGRRQACFLPNSLRRYAQWDLTEGSIRCPGVQAVVHSAARVGDWGPDSQYESVNVEGTRVALSSFVEARQFVHISSASVYAKAIEGTQITEQSPLEEHGANAYVRTKVQAERVVAASGRPAIILRPHIVYGPGDTTLMPRVLAARRWGWLPVPGNGRNFISVTHVFNLVHAVECALRTPAAEGAFNVVDLENATVDEFVRTMLVRHGKEGKVLYLPRVVANPLASAAEHAWRWSGAQRAPPLTRYLVEQLTGEHRLDATKARERLGYSPHWTFRDGPIMRGES